MADDMTVTDAAGRKIALRVLDPMDMLDLLEAAGDKSTNAGWVRYAAAICSVTQIGDVPVPAPKTSQQVRNLARKLGNEGLVAVYNKLNPPVADADDAPPDDAPPALATTEALAKN